MEAPGTARKGPLAGLRIVEFAGIGPCPMAGMLLADLGADVIIVDRMEPTGLGIERLRQFDVSRRGRPSVAVDLKQVAGRACALDLVARADAVIEGFRPGVMERLGLGPEACLARNPALVYGRVTGWGQDGPLAQAAGHDLNYIALSGALSAIGRAGEPPAIPLNLIGDYGAGAMMLAFGVVCALLEARQSGQGQVVDAAMADGTTTLMAALFGMAAAGLHREGRGTNLLDSGAPHYETYQCADGEWITVAPIEPKFRAILLQAIGFDPAMFPNVNDPRTWVEGKALLVARFAERSRAEWCTLLEGTDACFAPVLRLSEAPGHPHAVARGTFVDIEGVTQPAPQPRFSRTVPDTPGVVQPAGGGGHAALRAWGLSDDMIAAWLAEGAVHCAPAVTAAGGGGA
ncbi:alpha-methylacyl-CoA racemase [Caenibius tardaugens NBRC 16725]|uniref:Alpha-methylacyl-CoA racemase n=1 Tax=Caenibius tardaugens NBRC 16725 TaxID=1219035 RepID=U2YMS3_9SPHN|nr:CaiB/BaiF CoA-transferase family protein [Caenibius tardaugens]AZI35638.1 CoA transferase [Caenibius tardaugens NBRC 16725]GAD50075.1 alpha-methylacyl-CoA racemase [Caenibius tardaugens NBRC 16725]